MIKNTPNTNTSNNSHIASYLEYYLSLSEAPHYAILLDGEWGIGKTFLIKSLLRSKLKLKDNDYIYVSLYGLKSAEAIDKALLSALYPLIYNKGVKFAGKLIKAGLSYFGNKTELDFKLGDALSKFKAKVYIFDDLERCEIPLKETFGYINEFVEHDECKVILIANSKEIPDKETFKKQQEKLVGKTFIVQSELDNAFSDFINKIQDTSTKNLYVKFTPTIKRIYEQSVLNNLRVLQQILWDFERLCISINPNFLTNDQATNQIVQLFFALSFELRAGRIEAKDLRNRLNTIVSGISNKKMSGQSSPIIEANDRYSDIELYDTIISDEILEDMLTKGIFDAIKINECLARSEYFSNKSEQPIWRKIWSAQELMDEEFEISLQEFNLVFDERKFLKIGEMLHAFGIKLWLTELGATGLKMKEVEKQCIEYIDDLFSQKILEPTPLNSFEENLIFSGYEGLAIHQSNTASFKRISEHLESRRSAIRELSYPQLGEELLNEMKTDSLLFYKRITSNSGNESLYTHIPILAHIDPNRFTTSVIELDPKSQIRVIHALDKRYPNLVPVELEIERDWIKQIHKKINKASKNLSPLARARLTRTLDRIVARIDQSNLPTRQ